jgi:hypothetical protein
MSFTYLGEVLLLLALDLTIIRNRIFLATAVPLTEQSLLKLQKNI